MIPCDKRKFSGLGSRRPAYPISPRYPVISEPNHHPFATAPLGRVSVRGIRLTGSLKGDVLFHHITSHHIVRLRQFYNSFIIESSNVIAISHMSSLEARSAVQFHSFGLLLEL